MGGGIESGDKYGINGEGVGGVLQVVCSYGYDIWEQELGGGWGHVKSTREIP